VSADGDVATVNGSVRCGSGSTITGDVTTVNGSIRLDGSTAKGDITTHNGSVELTRGSVVERDVVIKESGGSSSGRTLRILVADGSVVHGDVVVEDSGRKVTVELVDGGEVKGEIRGAEVVERSSEAPATPQPEASG